MTLRKLDDIPLRVLCRHPEHDPPYYQHLDHGRYEHECPACGRRVEFTVSRVGYGPEPPCDMTPRKGGFR